MCGRLGPDITLGGVKFSDFIAHYKLDDQTKLQYVGMETLTRNIM